MKDPAQVIFGCKHSRKGRVEDESGNISGNSMTKWIQG